nr:RNA-directed DNA polymerase, eukaryota [Tanacetum cinerariifolium]
MKLCKAQGEDMVQASPNSRPRSRRELHQRRSSSSRMASAPHANSILQILQLSAFLLPNTCKNFNKGDENTKFFHGILNSKSFQLAIRGTLVDGEWIVVSLSLEQQVDLERNVSNEEIKSAVWDCGTNKSSGPDDFTFKFFHIYSKLLEHDIVATVNFFSLGIPIDSSLTLSHIFFADDAIFVDEEALRETLEEQARDEKKREEKIRQKQAEDEEFMLEFGKVVEEVGEDDNFKSGSWVSATNYVNANGGTVTGCFGRH